MDSESRDASSWWSGPAVRDAGRLVGVPVLVAVISTLLTNWITHSPSDRHQISVSIARSDNGTDDTYDPLLGGTNPFAPEVTPGIPATEFSYTALIRNDGDFSEENIVISIVFRGAPAGVAPLSVVGWDASSDLLRRTFQPAPPTESWWKVVSL